jgi:hypothetical protein
MSPHKGRPLFSRRRKLYGRRRGSLGCADRIRRPPFIGISSPFGDKTAIRRRRWARPCNLVDPGAACRHARSCRRAGSRRSAIGPLTLGRAPTGWDAARRPRRDPRVDSLTEGAGRERGLTPDGFGRPGSFAGVWAAICPASHFLGVRQGSTAARADVVRALMARARWQGVRVTGRHGQEPGDVSGARVARAAAGSRPASRW